MADILSLVPSCGTVAPATTIADDLRSLADSIERGEYGDATSFIGLVVDRGGTIVTEAFGADVSIATAVGYMEFAKLGMMWGEDD